MKYFEYPDPEKNIYSRPDLSLDKLKNSYLYMMEILESSKREELPDAWLATSDYLAFGMMRAINEKDIPYRKILLLSVMIILKYRDMSIRDLQLWNRIRNYSEELYGQ